MAPSSSVRPPSRPGVWPTRRWRRSMRRSSTSRWRSGSGPPPPLQAPPPLDQRRPHGGLLLGGTGAQARGAGRAPVEPLIRDPPCACRRLCPDQPGRPGRDGRLGDPCDNRFRLRPRGPLAPWRARSARPQGLPPERRHLQRHRGDHHHRHLQHERARHPAASHRRGPSSSSLRAESAGSDEAGGVRARRRRAMGRSA